MSKPSEVQDELGGGFNVEHRGVTVEEAREVRARRKILRLKLSAGSGLCPKGGLHVWRPAPAPRGSSGSWEKCDFCHQWTRPEGYQP